MSEISKYLEFVFKDFPESEEVAAEKKKLQNYMEVVYQEKISFGSSKVDALEAALDAVGDIRELHRKLEVQKIDIPNVYQMSAGESGSLKVSAKKMLLRLSLLIVIAALISSVILIIKNSYSLF